MIREIMEVVQEHIEEAEEEVEHVKLAAESVQNHFRKCRQLVVKWKLWRRPEENQPGEVRDFVQHQPAHSLRDCEGGDEKRETHSDSPQQQ